MPSSSLAPYGAYSILFCTFNNVEWTVFTSTFLTSLRVLKTLEGWRMCDSDLLSLLLSNIWAHNRWTFHDDPSCSYDTLQSLHQESPLDSLHLLHATILHLLTPLEVRKQKVLKCVVICPKSLSKKVAVCSWVVWSAQSSLGYTAESGSELQVLGSEVNLAHSFHPVPRATSAPLLTRSQQL